MRNSILKNVYFDSFTINTFLRIFFFIITQIVVKLFHVKLNNQQYLKQEDIVNRFPIFFSDFHAVLNIIKLTKTIHIILYTATPFQWGKFLFQSAFKLIQARGITKIHPFCSHQCLNCAYWKCKIPVGPRVLWWFFKFYK